MTESQRPDPAPIPSLEPLDPPPMGDVAIKPSTPAGKPSSPGDDNEDDQTRAGN